MRHQTQQWKVCSSLKVVKVEVRPAVGFHGKRRPALWWEIVWNGNCVKCFGTRWSERSKKPKPRYAGKNLEAHTSMWTVSKKSRPSWAKHWGFSRPSSPTGRKQVLMGGPLYSEGTGLLLAGAAVFVVGFFVFCCIDHCWLRRDLRKADRWSIFPSSSNSNSASDSMYSPWNSLTLRERCQLISFFSHPESVAVSGQSFQKIQCLRSSKVV